MVLELVLSSHCGRGGTSTIRSSRVLRANNRLYGGPGQYGSRVSVKDSWRGPQPVCLYFLSTKDRTFLRVTVGVLV